MYARCAQLAAVLVLILPSVASAIEYDVDVDVQNEEELVELQSSGELSEEDAAALAELLQDGVDLNSAGRDELYELPNLTYSEVDALIEYRQLAGRIDDPDQLVAAGVFDEETLRKLRPFIAVSTDDRKLDLKGSAKLQTLFTAADDRAPPLSLQLRMKGLQGLRGGLLVTTTRNRVGAVSYDPTREALVAYPAAYGAHVPKFYLQWNMKDFTVLAGAYRIGFGEKLTLSNSNRKRPSGFSGDDTLDSSWGLRSPCRLSQGELGADEAPCPEALDGTLIADDFDWSERFRGFAATAKDLRLGNTGAKVELTGFGSYQTRSVYQYSLYDRGACPDPRLDEDECGSPPVYVRNPDPSLDAARYMYETMPDLYDELFGGAHALFSLPSGLKIGALGWGASPQWRVSGANLDFNESFRVPFGGPYGAAGAYAAYGLGKINFSGEVTRTFDSSVGNGGGFGVLQRTVLTARKRELEITLRYYDKRFDNPYASPVSGSDMFEGSRARNEAGLRLKYLDSAFDDWKLNGTVNVWMLPEETQVPGTAGVTTVETYARAQFRRFKLLMPELWASYRRSGIATAVAEANEDDDPEEQFFCVTVGVSEGAVTTGSCAQNRLRAGGQLTVDPTRWVQLKAKYSHSWADNGPTGSGTLAARPWVEDRRVVLQSTFKPTPRLRLIGKVNYFDEDIADPARLETSIWSTAEAAYWVVEKKLNLRVRYDTMVYIDQRESTAARRTNPWHAFRLAVEGRY